jgi:hypothetical protein
MRGLSFSVLLVISTVSTAPRAEVGVHCSIQNADFEAADIIPACRVPIGVVSTTRQDDMPASLRRAVREKLGPVVSPTLPFDGTDVVVTGHNRRLIFIGSRDDRWVIATEHGGRGYNDPIFAYAVSSDGLKATLLAERTAYPDTVCSAAEELLNLQPGRAMPLEPK